MEWSWQRIPAEYVVANVKLCRGGTLAKRKGFLHVRKGRIEGLGAGIGWVDGDMSQAMKLGAALA